MRITAFILSWYVLLLAVFPVYSSTAPFTRSICCQEVGAGEAEEHPEGGVV